MTQKRMRAVLTGLGLVLLSGAIGGCSSPTYGTGERPEMAMFREITGGIGAPKQEPISYQPRAPLVMPPAANLQPPVAGAQVAQANWPVDPDQTNKPGRFSGDDELTPQKRAELRALYGQLPEAPPRERQKREVKSTYQAIGAAGQAKQFSAAIAESKGSNCSERRYLTQPPTEYCAPADTAPQTFENIDKKPGLFSRIFGRS